ncbi:MAG: hypothetical protein R2912_03860 [Eubacteriales bacterium]
MVFSRALPDDLPELVSLYRLAARRMEAKGIFQWDDIYPDSHVISRDIEREGNANEAYRRADRADCILTRVPVSAAI